MKKLFSAFAALILFLTAAPAFSETGSFQPAADRALDALTSALNAQKQRIYVYREFGDTENHYTQKAKMAGLDDSLVLDMDENWRENPASGESCIRCTQITRPGDWGGWLFLNGWLAEGKTVPQLNDGSTAGQSMDLSGAEALTFLARGEKGGEKVEFFTCGFGYDGEWGTQYAAVPDSEKKKTLGFITLTPEWTEYTIDLKKADLSRVTCGFGYVLSGEESGASENVFYLDEICFTGDFSQRNAHPMLRSYDTDNLYIKNAAFIYDNALCAMAFLSAGKREAAEALLDSIVYAVENDRYQPGRIRNAYAAGDITSFPGWGGTARLPGWYDADDRQWYEDRYQTGSNVGNTSYATLALLQADALYGNERYLKTAVRLMDWVIENCQDDGNGFTAGYDGWPESGPDDTYLFTYKSIEHNIDAYAAFRQLFARTGETKYAEAAASALQLIQSLYDHERGLFCTGTGDDGKTPSTENIVLDAQVWSCMALGDAFAPYEDALEIVADMKLPEGGYPFCAANINGGWWAEGTAYTALMYLLRGENEPAEKALKALESIQMENGLFPAATVPNLSTGFGLFDGSPWEYGNAAHIAPTAWFVMAVNRFNPYTFPDNP